MQSDKSLLFDNELLLKLRTIVKRSLGKQSIKCMYAKKSLGTL